MPSLLALFGPKRGVKLELHDGFVVGRSSTADLQLVDAKVSREHCRFRVCDDSTQVEDLGSHNGTYVNGARSDAPVVLRPGDEVAVGDSLLVFEGQLDVCNARFGDSTILLGACASAGSVPSGVESEPSSPASAAPRALADALSAASDMETAAEALLAAMERAFEPQRAYVLLHDERRGSRPLVGRSRDGVMAVSRTVLELAAQRGQAVALRNALEERALVGSRSVARHRLRSVMAAPVSAAGRTTGFLCCDRESPVYGAADAALLDSFAAVAAAHGLCGAFRPSSPASNKAEAEGPIGTSVVFRQALRIAEAAAAAPSTVLLTGESGTGKEEVARFIHRRSPRTRGPFIVVNCGAIPESLAESHLFGHERGAFTGAITTQQGLIEAADGGTLFLDEIGELPTSLQVKLLRVLQERAVTRVGAQVVRRVDVRIIAATNRDLEADVRAGRFREDLFYRLNVIRIPLPPLRARCDDIVLLAAALLERIAATLGRRNPGLDGPAATLLTQHSWPGNVRELQNILERVLVLRDPTDTAPLRATELQTALPSSSAAASTGPRLMLADKIAALERAEIGAALRVARGVKSRAALALGISRPTLDKKIAELGIEAGRDGESDEPPSGDGETI